MIEAIHKFGPHQAIIVRSNKVKEELRSSFQKRYGHPPLIFTIFEIKGLEFERNLIWDFFPKYSEEAAFWEDTFRQINLGNEEKIRNDNNKQRTLASETNLLYVGVTRGSHYCYIFDNDTPSAFWNYKPIHERMQVHRNLAILQESEEHLVETTDQDWLKEGLRLLKKKLYDQALDCFNRIENTWEISIYKHECLGYLARENENFDEALEHFKKANMHEEVVACLDIKEQFITAYNYIKKLLYDLLVILMKSKHGP